MPDVPDPVSDLCARNQTVILSVLLVLSLLLLALLLLHSYLISTRSRNLVGLITKQTPKVTRASLHVMIYSASLRSNHRHAYPPLAVPCSPQEVAWRCARCQAIYAILQQYTPPPLLPPNYGVHHGVQFGLDGLLLFIPSVARTLPRAARAA